LTRQIVQDFAALEDSKIVQDDDKFLVVKAVIASEIVHKYKDGMAYKPADGIIKGCMDCGWQMGKSPKSPSKRPHQKRK
jgi:hypothetical protein